MSAETFLIQLALLVCGVGGVVLLAMIIDLIVERDNK